MGKRKILLVDDSETILLYEKLMLGSNYQFVTAKNGRKGLEMAEKELPDLILLDIMMPEMDGLECLKALHEKDSTKKIPVIMVTTKTDQHRVESAYRFGCSDFVTKPVDKTDLVRKVEKLLNGG
jgi:CheY-like chemotaxis protein